MKLDVFRNLQLVTLFWIFALAISNADSIAAKGKESAKKTIKSAVEVKPSNAKQDGISSLPETKTAEGNPENRRQNRDGAKLKAISLGDASIYQNTLRVFLSRPALITLHDASGQLLHSLESVSSTEYFPLRGVNSGFLYLTIRDGKKEFVKKLVYTGK